jgi:hypothetical protein
VRQKHALTPATVHATAFVSGQALACDTGEEELGFTEFVESLTRMADLVQILAGLGVITVLMAILKRYAEQRRWQNFKLEVEDWLDRLRDTEHRHPRELDDREWKVACERMLTDARFSPVEIHQLLGTSVVVAKGIASDKFFF